MKRVNVFSTLAGFTLVFVLLYFAVIHNRMNLYFGISFLIIYSVFIINYLNNKSPDPLIDIRLYLVLLYDMYSLYAPIVYMIYNNTGYINISNIVNYYSYDTLVKTVVISILFFIPFSISLAFFPHRLSQTNCEKSPIHYKVSRFGFYYWLALFIISFALYIDPYIKLGLAEALKYGRWERYVIFSGITGSDSMGSKVMKLFFSQYLIIVSIYKMFMEVYSAKNKKAERSIFIILVFFVAVFYLFIDGRRREFMYIGVMCFSYYMYYLSGKFKKKNIKKYVACILIIGAFFIAYQGYRDYFSIANSEGISYALQVQQNNAANTSIEKKLYTNEFAMVYENLLMSVDFKPDQYYGKTYIEGIIGPIPVVNKLFYGNGDKTSLLINWQSQIYPDIFLQGGGLGFSPAAEAYVNLGYAGCIVFGFIFGVLFNFIYFKLYNKKYIWYYCLLLPEGWNFNRISFMGVAEEIFWFSIYAAIYSLILRILENNKGKGLEVSNEN